MTQRVGFVVFDGVTMLDVSGPSEVLHQAGSLGHHYDLVLLSTHGGDVRTSSGLTLSGTVTATDAGALDTLVGREGIASPSSRSRTSCWPRPGTRPRA
ncbi:hypothetical protein [Saccharomonospora azurea]|uniref:hypothetical protein n=1 Tax=Saccharomonospora azurea TaxID=40988 RepID=UPI0026CA18AC